MTDTAKAGTGPLYALLDESRIACDHHTQPPLFTVQDWRARSGASAPEGRPGRTVPRR